MSYVIVFRPERQVPFTFWVRTLLLTASVETLSSQRWHAHFNPLMNCYEKKRDREDSVDGACANVSWHSSTRHGEPQTRIQKNARKALGGKRTGGNIFAIRWHWKPVSFHSRFAFFSEPYQVRRLKNNACSSAGLRPGVGRSANASGCSLFEWGLFTKWRRSGSAGHFCTRVHAGCMAGCVRAEKKLTLGELLFTPFAWKRVGWYLQTISVFEKLEKIKRQKELEQDITIFLRIDDGEQCGTQNNVQHCRAPSTVTRTTVVGGKRRLRLKLFSPQKKVSTPSVLAVLALCLRFLAFVTVSRPPRVYQIWLTRYCTCVVYSSESQRRWKLQLMFSSPSFDYQTWRKGSLPGGWKHTGTLAIVMSPRASKWVRSFRNICVSLRSTFTACWQTQVFGVLSDLSPIILPSESKISIVTRKGCRAEKIFVGMMLFCPNEKEKTKKEVLG